MPTCSSLILSTQAGRATLDGQPVRYRPAQVAFRAVYVPAGTHEVVFRYQPAGFATGGMVSIAGLVIAALFVDLAR